MGNAAISPQVGKINRAVPRRLLHDTPGFPPERMMPQRHGVAASLNMRTLTVLPPKTSIAGANGCWFRGYAPVIEQINHGWGASEFGRRCASARHL
jgi:hypothetical protein